MNLRPNTMMLALVLMGSTLLTAQPAYAISYWACIATEAAFEDNDNIEAASIALDDEYDDDDTNPMNGATVRIRYSPRSCAVESSWTGSDIQTLWNGDLNYDGCTTQMVVSTTGGVLRSPSYERGHSKVHERNSARKSTFSH